jgi:5-methylcytosine-specific restriction endonuclease McrA
MPARPPVRCPVCGQATPPDRPHPHARQVSPPVSWEERQRRAEAVEAWRRRHGDWCPGWQRPPHATADLTADHVLPRSQGGEGGPLRVLCRACNARRGNREVQYGIAVSTIGGHR